MDSVPDIVDAVLILLVALSVLTWTIVFVKLARLWQDRRDDRRFMTEWLAMADLPAAAARPESPGPLARLARAGRAELDSLGAGTAPHLGPRDRREMLQLALRQQMHREQARLENGLAILASIGSTSPFIGLFGTVWGIMGALQGISLAGSASLDVVAGPIGEALIATAMGIAAAIPAVLAYNYFLRRIRLAVTAMDHFGSAFVHRAIRSGYGEL